MSNADDHEYFDDDGCDDEDDFEFECGAFINGSFDYFSCGLAGTEECDWERPHGWASRIKAMKDAGQ